LRAHLAERPDEARFAIVEVLAASRSCTAPQHSSAACRDLMFWITLPFLGADAAATERVRIRLSMLET
jgi:hypothetical protein